MTDTEKVYESMNFEDLENTLPLYVRKEIKEALRCPFCRKTIKNYSDTYVRVEEIHYEDGEEYAISYRLKGDRSIILFRTGRYMAFRQALIEAHQTLTRMGLHPYEPEEG
jgi:hypothetical protein